MKTPACLTALSLLAASALPAAAQNGKPDPEGFIRNWLVLAPLANPDGSGADALDKKQFPKEASPAAKEGAVKKSAAKNSPGPRVHPRLLRRLQGAPPRAKRAGHRLGRRLRGLPRKNPASR